MSYSDWEDASFESLIEGKEYKVGWISSVYTNNHQIDRGDMLIVTRKEHGGNLTVKKSSLSVFDQFQQEHCLSYQYITLLNKKIEEPKKQLCICTSRTLMIGGCLCGAFKAGDK